VKIDRLFSFYWQNKMFQGLRWHLLISYLMVMAVILGVFGTGVYLFLTRSLYQQLDKKLLTLAQSAAPSLAEIQKKGTKYLEQINEVPWRDIFNRDQQSLEWFDTEGNLLASRGALELKVKPKLSAQTIQRREEPKKIRTFTISVYQDSSQPQQPILKGYIRASQSNDDVEVVQTQLLWGLAAGGMLALGLVALGGLWLTQKAIKPVEQSFQQLKQFTTDASHELRSPLTAIKTSVDVMRNHPERIHAKDFKKLAAISSATNQMSCLVEDLLFLARTNAPETSLNGERVLISLNRLLQNVFSFLESSAQIKEITFEYQSLATLNVMGDKSQLTRLFTNLLENALHYTPSGGRVDLIVGKQNRFALVTIKDTGIGIAPEQLPYIFDRFWRADRARSRRQGGTGLGLSIAKAITQAHGGKIIVHSSLDRGSCFQVRLPLSSVSQAHKLV
jgi:two-component system, OmpR family, manganese sensing sensor histidine kinase